MKALHLHYLDLFMVIYRSLHDDIIKRKHFPRYWPFVRGIHRSPVNSPHKGQWRGALMFSLICVWINGWVNNREAGDLRRYRAHYDVTVMERTSSRDHHAVQSTISNTAALSQARLFYCVNWLMTHLILGDWLTSTPVLVLDSFLMKIRQ